jgi:hypothetical protein
MMAIGLAAAATSHAAGVTDQMIDTESSASGNVLSWGGTPQGQRFSPLNKINTANVSKLTPVWAFSFGGEKQRGQESQPLIYNGRMFVTGSYSRLYALDAATGKKLWKYEHRLPEGIMPCCDVVNRGAALYDDLVIFATLDAQLVALKQDTGEVVWKTKIDDYAAGYSATAAPIIANGLLLTGVSGGEFGVVGRVEARDPKTGKLVWTRPTVEGHMGYIWDKDGNKKENGISGTTNQTWPGDLWKTGGAATWLGGTYDPRPAWPTSAPATRPLEQPPAQGRQPVLLLHRRHRREDRQDRLALPGHAQRQLGLRRRQRVHHLRPGRQAPGRQGRPQRLLLRARCHHRQAAERLPLRQEDHLGFGRRPEDRPPELRAGKPPGRPDRATARRAARCSRRRASWAARTRCRWPTARRPTCSTCRPTSGAWRSGTSRWPTRRARPTWARASPSSR